MVGSRSELTEIEVGSFPLGLRCPPFFSPLRLAGEFELCRALFSL